MGQNAALASGLTDTGDAWGPAVARAQRPPAQDRRRTNTRRRRRVLVEGSAEQREDEAELLRLCARTYTDDREADRVRRIARMPIDWGRFVQVAEHHAVLPLVVTSLERVGASVPAAVASTLAPAFRAQAMWNMTLSAELVRLLAALRERGVQALSFKGAALGLLAYGNLALRPFTDLDLLVRPADVAATVRVLESLGYPGWDAGRNVEQYILGECEETFVHPSGNATVDLHWALSRGYLPFPVPFDRLLARSQTLSLGGADVVTLGTDDLLLFLCLHGGKHAWERLLWVCDIAELLRARPDVDLAALLDRAASMGSRRVVLVGLELARSILDAPVPQCVTDAVASDPGVADITEPLRERMLFGDLTRQAPASPLSGAVGQTLFHLRMLDRPRDRLLYLMHAAVPNPRDRGSLALPAPLRGLYFLVRPIRLLARYGLARGSPS